MQSTPNSDPAICVSQQNSRFIRPGLHFFQSSAVLVSLCPSAVSDFYSWLAGLEPKRLFCSSSPSSSRFDMLFILRLCFGYEWLSEFLCCLSLTWNVGSSSLWSLKSPRGYFFCFLIFSINTAWICGHVSAWFYALLLHDCKTGLKLEINSCAGLPNKALSECPLTRLHLSLSLIEKGKERQPGRRRAVI